MSDWSKVDGVGGVFLCDRLELGSRVDLRYAKRADTDAEGFALRAVSLASTKPMISVMGFFCIPSVLRASRCMSMSEMPFNKTSLITSSV